MRALSVAFAVLVLLVVVCPVLSGQVYESGAIRAEVRSCCGQRQNTSIEVRVTTQNDETDVFRVTLRFRRGGAAIFRATKTVLRDKSIAYPEGVVNPNPVLLRFPLVEPDVVSLEVEELRLEPIAEEQFTISR